jgi:hypothetical protein
MREMYLMSNQDKVKKNNVYIYIYTNQDKVIYIYILPTKTR